MLITIWKWVWIGNIFHNNYFRDDYYQIQTREIHGASNNIASLTIFMCVSRFPKVPKPQNIDLSKPGFMPVMVWISPPIPDSGKYVSLYKHYEAIEHSSTWYIIYSSSYDHVHASTPTPESHDFNLSKPPFMPVVVWMSPSIPDSCNCVSHRSIVRL